MGKIFDALQKSTKKSKITLIQEDGFIEKSEVELPRKGSASDKPPMKRIQQQNGDGDVHPVILKDADLKIRKDGDKEPVKNVALHPLHRLDKSLIAVHAPHSYEAEQFRMLRTNILFPKKGRTAPRTILVTSALPGEGKSFVSANLAATIAQNLDNHVLLIDADMRNPTIHKLFGLGRPKGLSDYLNGGTPIPELLKRSHTQSLTILPGGQPPSNPAELLSSRRMAALLQEVRLRYDDRFIIIDSPPPHLTSESNALAQFVDGIIVVVKIDTTPRDLVMDLIKKFEKGKIAGIVANCMEQGTQPYYGADKYSKHYIGKKRIDN